ncbi:hypothetical protein LIA77_12032 [Sarocladium implicatum]|nr:hypothetical protein LIA77_12032 [Sarocladium implicatum]
MPLRDPWLLITVKSAGRLNRVFVVASSYTGPFRRQRCYDGTLTTRLAASNSLALGSICTFSLAKHIPPEESSSTPAANVPWLLGEFPSLVCSVSCLCESGSTVSSRGPRSPAEAVKRKTSAYARLSHSTVWRPVMGPGLLNCDRVSGLWPFSRPS